MKTCPFFIVLALFMGCEEPERLITVSGIVRNWGTKQPIEGATVGIQDWLAAGWKRDELKNTPGRYYEAITDANGYFELSIRTRENTFIWAGKEGAKWYKFDPDFSDGAYVGVKGVGPGDNPGQILELQSHSNFNPVFQKKATALDTDTIYIIAGSRRRFGEVYPPPYVGKGPFYYERYADSEGLLIPADTYVPYWIRQKINGTWTEKLDSVYLPGQVSFKETIYY
ncbi:MAG TPA: hypothetical protein VFE50_16750 [Cyclobacteriaceae bacterium]|nr:hypothetical protein [Cyclobacteriaceae bacterium]